jgi:hypothetical protein
MNEDFTSVLDKADWRKTIHKSLEEAVMSLGKDEQFWYATERAIQAMSATYPNWDAAEEVRKMVDTITAKHNRKAEFLLLSNRDMCYQFAFSWNRDGMTTRWKNDLYREILQELQNIAGKHRMLLWGIRKLPTGSMGNGDTDVSGDEVDIGTL